MNMNGKSKKMVATEKEIADLLDERDKLFQHISTLDAYRPESVNGKDAQKQALEKLIANRDELSEKIEGLRARLEVETVALMAGIDTDFAEPSPSDALREAS